MEVRSYFAATHPLARLILLGALMLGGMLVVLVLGMLAALPFMGGEILALAGGEGLAPGPENLNLMRYVQVLSHLGLFVVPSLLFAWMLSPRPMRYLALHRMPRGKGLLLALGIMLAALPVVGLLMHWNQQLSLPGFLQGLEDWMRRSEAAAEEMTMFFLRVDSWQGLLFNLFMIAILPAIGEELLFRGLIQKLVREWTRSDHLAVVITAVLFSAMHMQFLSFLPRLGLGVVLGYLLVWSGKLWLPVLAHFFNNAAALLVYYLHHRGVIDYDMEEIGLGLGGVLLAATGLVVLFWLFYWYRRTEYRPEAG
jgi:hypothetical protein